MSRIFIKGTRRFSNGRRDLSRAMEVRQIRRNPENSSYVAEADDVLINWGQSGEDYGNVPTWINHPSAVEVACNKTDSFDQWAISGVPTVNYTRCSSEARRWVSQAGVVMHRALARGSQGRGITLLEDIAGVTQARGGFFCQVFGDSENKEYRIHVVDGAIIDTTQKRRRSRSNGYTGSFDPTVRSANNGWVFCREGVTCPEAANIAAREAVRTLGLDFGAVDIAVSSDGRVCVYEVNTAPGLEGTTLVRYTASLAESVSRRLRGVGAQDNGSDRQGNDQRTDGCGPDTRPGEYA